MLEKWPFFIEPMERETNIHVYLPDDYYDHEEERYPVMYMFDGHNLFLDEDATFRKSWGLQQFLHVYEKPFIIVGIECDHIGDNRLQEYTPYALQYTFFGPTTGRGALLMHWIVTALKPYIDQRYRTWTHREATGIAGSSMGGLMAFYGVLHYNHYFSKAACLSPSINICENELKKELDEHGVQPDTKVYFSFGTRELQNKSKIAMTLQKLTRLEKALARWGASCMVNMVENGKHNEVSWGKESKTWFDYLWM